LLNMALFPLEWLWCFSCILTISSGKSAMGQGQYLNGRKILMAGRKNLPFGMQSG